jgi:hypothetical protein
MFLFTGAVRVMLSCGLSFATNVSDSSFDKNRPFGATSLGGFSHGSSLKLEPAIEDLLCYAQSVAAIESKYSREQGSQVYSKPPANSAVSRGLEALLAADTIGSRRVPMANEMKNVVSTELKKYTISVRVCTYVFFY